MCKNLICRGLWVFDPLIFIWTITPSKDKIGDDTTWRHPNSNPIAEILYRANRDSLFENLFIEKMYGQFDQYTYAI